MSQYCHITVFGTRLVDDTRYVKGEMVRGLYYEGRTDYAEWEYNVPLRQADRRIEALKRRLIAKYGTPRCDAEQPIGRIA